MTMIQDYLALTKPRLTALALLTAAAGFWMAAPGPLDWPRLAVTLLGAALTGAGGNALNQWYEREADALMARTQSRPLPAGRMAPEAACLFGLIAATLGVAVLAIFVNRLTAVAAFATVASYVGVYTPLKRVTTLCTVAGAVPGALPPVIGWAAAAGSLPPQAWALFALLFCWQLPHFLAIAWMCREDYARAGFRMLPVVEPDGASTARQALLYGVALVVVSVMPGVMHLTGPWYVVGALGLGVWLLVITVRAVRLQTAVASRMLFRASLAYLPAVLLLMAVNKWPM